MAEWTAKNIQIAKTEKDCSFTADIFRDAALHHAYAEPHVSQPDSIPAIIKQHLAHYSEIDKFDAATVGSTIDIKPPVPPEPTQEELDQQKFLADLAKYRATLGAVKLGILAQEEADSLKDALKAAFKPEYLQFLGGF